MKKTFVRYIIISSSFYLHISAMELAHSTIERTSSYQDFYSTPRAFNWIDQKNQTLTIKKLLLLQSKLFNHDVSNNIAYKLFVLYTKDEYENLEKICPLRLGNKKYTIEQVIQMSYEDRTPLLSLIHDNSFSQIINGSDSNMMIYEDDYKNIIKVLPNNMQEDLKIKVIPNKCKYLPTIFGSLMSLTGVGYSVYGIITSQASVVPACISLITGGIIIIVAQRGINHDRATDSEEYNRLLSEV